MRAEFDPHKQKLVQVFSTALQMSSPLPRASPPDKSLEQPLIHTGTGRDLTATWERSVGLSSAFNGRSGDGVRLQTVWVSALWLVFAFWLERGLTLFAFGIISLIAAE
jgi:hypothetical protein